MFSGIFNRLCRSYLGPAFMVATVTITVLYFLPHQTDAAPVIHCQSTAAICYGTPGDDIIIAAPNGSIIHGLAGNDYIIGITIDSNYLYGDDGDDILLGGLGNDVLMGGLGNDRYDASSGDDSIQEYSYSEGSFYNDNDVISSGWGNDYILSGEGADRIDSGPGNDQIIPDAIFWRDFSPDIINCGSGSDQVQYFHSPDPDTANNCEVVDDYG